jgi:hypothetical protein
MALSVALAACGQGVRTLDTAPAMRTLAVTDQGAIQTTGSQSDRTTYDASAERVFSALVAALPEVGVEASLVDATQRSAGNPRFQRSRTLGKLPLSMYFNCGSGMTGPKADSDRLTITLMSSVDVVRAGTAQLRTSLTATAQSMSGASTGVVDCGSTGKLETALRDAVGRRLATP